MNDFKNYEFENFDFKVDVSELEDEKAQVTSIVLMNQFGQYSITSYDDVDNITDFKDLILEPLLLAMGYHPNNVNELFGENEPEVTIASQWELSPNPDYDIVTFNDPQTETYIGDYSISVGSRFVHTSSAEIYTIVLMGHNIVGLYPAGSQEPYDGLKIIGDIHNITEEEFSDLVSGNEQFFEQLDN